nr:reverse transcriptase domain-containing protein [Tanacetum cinerariifolium]
MADQRTMAELLRAPTKGYAEAIVVPSILADQFELKHSLINMMTTDQTTNLYNEISNFQQRFDESFHEAWDRYKDLIRACPHHGFTELHQLDTYYNALNPADQDSLNAATSGNLLERRTQDVLTIIKNKSKVHNSRNKSVVSQVQSCDANSNSSSEIAKLTHAVNQQTSDVTTAITAILKEFQATLPLTFVKAVEEIYVTCGCAHPYYQCLAVGGSGSLPSNTVANPKGELKAITTQSEETLTDPDPSEYTIKVPPPLVQKYKPLSKREYIVHQRDPLHPNIPYHSRMLKQKQQEKDKVQIQKNWQMFKQLHINITLADALILMANELKCKALADLGASINLMPFSVWKKLGLSELISTRMTLELANRAICTPAGIARDVFVPVGKFTFPADFAIVDYESDLRVSFILGRPFLRTARALINVHDLDSIKDLHPPLHVNPLSGSTTSSSSPNPLLKEFTDVC